MHETETETESITQTCILQSSQKKRKGKEITTPMLTLMPMLVSEPNVIVRTVI